MHVLPAVAAHILALRGLPIFLWCGHVPDTVHFVWYDVMYCVALTVSSTRPVSLTAMCRAEVGSSSLLLSVHSLSQEW